jgi:hypothetical protein
MYQIPDKDIIEMKILCHIPLNKRGFRPKSFLYEDSIT